MPTAMSQRLKWIDAFSVGHAVLDAEHRDLIDRINQLCAALDAKEDMTPKHPDLRALTHAVKEHFDHEGAVLNEVVSGTSASVSARTLGETAINEHVSAHESAFVDLHAIIGNIERSALDRLPDYCEDLVRWFVDHSIKYDSHLKAVFQAM
jgi:hemerythrin-like metal-binding protein